MLQVIEGKSKTAGPGHVELVRFELPGGRSLGPIARSQYSIQRLDSAPGMAKLLIEETEEGAAARGNRVERLPPKDVKSMNLSFDWLHIYLPFCLRKIDRVTFGIMSTEQAALLN